MVGRIVILGWGSLIWNPDILHIDGVWQTGGPILPIEFSRISDNGRLTLVVDEQHGVDVPTRYALSAFTTLDDAIENLRIRENAPNRSRIGYVDLAHNRTAPYALRNHPGACDSIRAWAGQVGFAAAIWTALGPRFQEKALEPFSVDAAVRYVLSLTGTTRDDTMRYIQNAPPETATPVRTALTPRLT